MIHSIGLTGGIGSGKSTIAGILKQLGYPVYLADPEASRSVSYTHLRAHDTSAHVG